LERNLYKPMTIRNTKYKSISVNTYCYSSLERVRDDIQKQRDQSGDWTTELAACTIPNAIEIMADQYLLVRAILHD